MLSILREHYADFGQTLAAEKLRTRHMRRTCIGELIQIADCLLSHVGSSSQAGVYPAAVGLSSERRRVRRWCTSTMRPVVRWRSYSRAASRHSVTWRRLAVIWSAMASRLPSTATQDRLVKELRLQRISTIEAADENATDLSRSGIGRIG